MTVKEVLTRVEGLLTPEVWTHGWGEEDHSKMCLTHAVNVAIAGPGYPTDYEMDYDLLYRTMKQLRRHPGDHPSVYNDTHSYEDVMALVRAAKESA